MRIIALAGLAQSGKTTVRAEIARLAFDAGYTPHLRSFAGPLKQACEIMGASKETNPELYRKTCQYIGKNYRDPDFVPGVTGSEYWVDMMANEIHAIAQAEADTQLTKGTGRFFESLLLIDDMRYKNERGIVRACGGTTVFVDGSRRLGLHKTRFEDLPEWRQDPSEMMAWSYGHGNAPDDSFDFTFTNNGSMESLTSGVETMFRFWTGEIDAD